MLLARAIRAKRLGEASVFPSLKMFSFFLKKKKKALRLFSLKKSNLYLLKLFFNFVPLH
jgi:hypothetical protein